MGKMLLFILIAVAIETRGNYAVLGTCFGMSIGTLIGVVIKSVAIYAIFGGMIGMFVGAFIKKK